MPTDASVGEITTSVSTFESRGTTYKLSPPTIKDLGDFEKWQRNRPHRAAREKLDAYGDVLTAEERVQILDKAEAESKATKETFTDAANLEAAFKALQGDREAMTYFIYLTMRQEHPDLSYDEAMALLARAEIENLSAAVAQSQELPGSSEAGDSGKP